MKETNFKPSPLGPIPHDWEVIPLGNLGEVQMCKRIFSNQTSETGEIPFFKIGTLGKAPDAFISRELYENYKKLYNFPLIGELLISAAGTIGRIHKYDGADCYYQDSNIVWLRNDERQVSNRYLAQTFKIIKWQSQDGGTISRLYNSNFRATLCCYPTSLQEQERIAGALSDVDELIVTTEALLQKKRDIKQGTMQQLLSGQYRLPGFTQPWENITLKDIFKIGNGKDFKHLGKGCVPVFGTGGIIAFVDDYLMEGETICIGRKGTLNKPFYFNGRIWTVDTLFYTYDFVNTDVKFLSYIISCIQWNNKSEATGVPSLNTTIILRESVYIPSDLAEQQAIAKVLTDMDNEIEALENNLAKYKDIREAMMQQLLTGKIRLI